MRLLVALVALAGVGLAITWIAGVWPFGPRRLQVVDEDGEPLSHALVLVRRVGETAADFADTADDMGWVVVPRKAIRGNSELLATAPACGIIRGPVPPDGRVVLPEGILVTLTVPGDLPLPQPPAELVLRFEPDGDEGAWSMMLAEAVAPPDYWGRDEMDRTRELAIDAGTRTARVVVPRAGRWRFGWSVMHWEIERSGGLVSRSGSGSGPGEPVVLQIPGGDAPVELPIDPDELRKHVAR